MIFGPGGNALLPSTAAFIERMFGASGLYPYLGDVLPTAKTPGAYQLNARNLVPAEGEVIKISISEEIALSATAAHHGPLPALAWRVDFDDVSLVFTGDTTNKDNAIQRLGTNVDLLVAHNAIPEGAGGSATSLHMRPSEIADIVRVTTPKQLLLSHFMTRSIDEAGQTEAIIGKAQPQVMIHFAQELACYPLM